MNRTELATRIISTNPPSGFKPKVNDGPIFAGRFPGGFAPIGKVADGNFLEFCPEQIGFVGRDLSDRQFLRLCEAIRSYQHMTIPNFSLRLPADLIVEAFLVDEPEHGAMLAVTAARAGLTIVRFLGADRGTGIHT